MCMLVPLCDLKVWLGFCTGWVVGFKLLGNSRDAVAKMRFCYREILHKGTTGIPGCFTLKKITDQVCIDKEMGYLDHDTQTELRPNFVVLVASQLRLINACLRVSGSCQHEICTAVFLAANCCFWRSHCGHLGFRFTGNRRGKS